MYIDSNSVKKVIIQDNDTNVNNQEVKEITIKFYPKENLNECTIWKESLVELCTDVMNMLMNAPRGADIFSVNISNESINFNE